MSELIFKVVIVLDHQLSHTGRRRLLNEVKKCMQDCDLHVSFIDFFQATKSDEDFHPEIEELIVQVEAECSSSYPRSPRRQLEQFLRNFKSKSHHLPCCYIMLYNDYSFMAANPFMSVSEVNCHNSGALQFGTLPHDGYFHKYASLENIDKIMFYHVMRNVVIHRGEFEIRFSYDNIRNIFVNIQSYPTQLFIDLFNPPIIYRVEHIVINRRSSQTRHRNLNMNGKIDPGILGCASVLCLPIHNYNMELDMIIANIRYQCSSKPIYYSSILTKQTYAPSATELLNRLNKYNIDFGCMYMISAILQRNFILLAQLPSKQDFLKVLTFSEQNPRALESALGDVLTTLESGRILNYWNVIENRFHYYVAVRNTVDFKEYIVPPKCCMTRRITITPTRLLLWAPELLFGNRVVRNFDPEFAVRISFRDDNMHKLTSPALNADKGFMEKCVMNPMTEGIHIGIRKYEFLAWSNSQLRDHGVWMYAKDSKGITSADIRNWMGDFSHIHNVPKCMARMGQCFSQTVDTISLPLEPQSIQTVPDIERGYDPENGKPYNFSDGIGRISAELAAEVRLVLLLFKVDHRSFIYFYLSLILYISIHLVRPWVQNPCNDAMHILKRVCRLFFNY